MQQTQKTSSDRLVYPYSAKIKAISILDEFEKRNKRGDPIYHSLLLLGCFDILKCELYSVSLVICRWDWRESFINEFTSFTRFERLVGGKHFEPTAKNTGFLSCIFTGASFFATIFEDCKMLGSDFRNSECALVKIDGGDWSYTNLHKLSFQKQEFIGIRFCGADLTEARFNQCKIKDCEFEEAIVKETSFYKCDMRGSLLHGMNLFEINLKGALLSLEQCVLAAEYITGCKFEADEKQ